MDAPPTTGPLNLVQCIKLSIAGVSIKKKALVTTSACEDFKVVPVLRSDKLPIQISSCFLCGFHSVFDSSNEQSALQTVNFKPFPVGESSYFSIFVSRITLQSVHGMILLNYIYYVHVISLQPFTVPIIQVFATHPDYPNIAFIDPVLPEQRSPVSPHSILEPEVQREVGGGLFSKKFLL